MLLMAAAVALVGCEKLGPDHGPPFDSDAPSQTIVRTRIIWSENGAKSAVIQANELVRYPQRDEISLRDSVQVELFDEHGKLVAVVSGEQGIIDDQHRTARVDSGITIRFLGTDEYRASTLTADRARAEDATKRVTAFGNVRIESQTGMTLTTEELLWDGRSRRFTATGFVRITNGTEVEEGEGLDANADLTEWAMVRVRGRSTRPREEVESQLRREARR